MKKRQLNVKVSTREYDALAKAAADEARTVTDLVREFARDIDRARTKNQGDAAAQIRTA